MFNSLCFTFWSLYFMFRISCFILRSLCFMFSCLCFMFRSLCCILRSWMFKSLCLNVQKFVFTTKKMVKGLILHTEIEMQLITSPIQSVFQMSFSISFQHPTYLSPRKEAIYLGQTYPCLVRAANVKDKIYVSYC